MFIVSGGRGTGKTKKLLEQALAENGTIVCRDPIVMRARAHKYGIIGLNIISYEELINHNIEQANEPLFIHDINKFIECTFPEVSGYTLCNE